MALLPPGCVWTWQTQPNRGVDLPDTVSKNVKKPLGLMVGTATPTACISGLTKSFGLRARKQARGRTEMSKSLRNMCGP